MTIILGGTISDKYDAFRRTTVINVHDNCSRSLDRLTWAVLTGVSEQVNVPPRVTRHHTTWYNIQGCVVFRGIKNVGRKPSWCRSYLEPFGIWLIPSLEN